MERKSEQPKFDPVQHREILETVENQLAGKDRNWRARARKLLMSDRWTLNSRLEGSPDDKQLRTDRDRVQAAIDKLERAGV